MDISAEARELALKKVVNAIIALVEHRDRFQQGTNSNDVIFRLWMKEADRDQKEYLAGMVLDRLAQPEVMEHLLCAGFPEERLRQFESMNTPAKWEVAKANLKEWRDGKAAVEAWEATTRTKEWGEAWASRMADRWVERMEADRKKFILKRRIRRITYGAAIFAVVAACSAALWIQLR
jgi:hypothetical protein